MSSLARWCVLHKARVIAAWVIALVVLSGLSASASAGNGYTDSFELSGSESALALDLLRNSFAATGLLAHGLDIATFSPQLRVAVDAADA